MEVYKQIISHLKDKGVEFEVLEHDFVHTSEDAAKTRGNKIEQAAKAIIMKSKSGKFYLFVVPGNMKAKLKKVKEILNEKNVSLASPEEVFQVTGLKVGSVTPFGQFFGLGTYFEESLLNQEKIVFAAGSHYKSISMKPGDFIKSVKVIIENFCELK